MTEKREELVEEMECDELCFMETNRELHDEVEDELERKQCPPCGE